MYLYINIFIYIHMYMPEMECKIPEWNELAIKSHKEYNCITNFFTSAKKNFTEGSRVERC